MSNIQEPMDFVEDVGLYFDSFHHGVDRHWGGVSDLMAHALNQPTYEQQSFFQKLINDYDWFWKEYPDLFPFTGLVHHNLLKIRDTLMSVLRMYEKMKQGKYYDIEAEYAFIFDLIEDTRPILKMEAHNAMEQLIGLELRENNFRDILHEIEKAVSQYDFEEAEAIFFDSGLGDTMEYLMGFGDFNRLGSLTKYDPFQVLSSAKVRSDLIREYGN